MVWFCDFPPLCKEPKESIHYVKRKYARYHLSLNTKAHKDCMHDWNLLLFLLQLSDVDVGVGIFWET